MNLLYQYLMKLILIDPSKKPELELIISGPSGTRLEANINFGEKTLAKVTQAKSEVTT